MTHQSSAYTTLPERLQAVARDAAALGFHDLGQEQLEGMRCILCGRAAPRMVPLRGYFGTVDGRFGGQQLFVCEDGIACAAAAEQLPPGPAHDGYRDDS